MNRTHWTDTTLGEITTFKSGGTPSKQNETFWGGQHPWISAKDLKTHYLSTSIDTLTDKGFAESKRAPIGSSLVLVRGMTLLKDFPVGYASRELAFNQDIKALIPEPGIEPLFLSYLLVSKKDILLQHVSVAGHGTGKLETEVLKELPVVIPPMAEQTKIAQILTTWDKAISSSERLLANSQQQKQALMQQLLTGQKRFAGFTEDWKRCALGQLFSERNEINRPDLSLLSITTEQGVIDRADSGKKDTSSEDKSKYRRICPGDIGYNTMRMWQGVSGLSDKEGIVSPAYTILQPTSLIDSRFASYLFKTPGLIHVFMRHSQGLVSDTWNLKYEHFAKIRVKVPCAAEQQKIAQVLATADAEIANLQAQLAKLRLEKKALMQQLLTGQRRVRLDDEVAPDPDRGRGFSRDSWQLAGSRG